MNGSRAFFLVVMYGMVEGCFLKSIQRKKGEQYRYNISKSSKKFFGNQVLNQERGADLVTQMFGDTRMRVSVRNTKRASGKLYVKSSNRGDNTGRLILRDRITEADPEEPKLPYISLPPNNVLPDEDKKVISINDGSKNTITRQQIPATAIPILVTSGPPSTIQIPNVKPLIPTIIPIPHTSPHPTPPPVNINLIMPTARPIVQAAPVPVNNPQQVESNVTKIDLSLNIGEEHEKQKPVIIQLPTTPPSAIIVPQNQKPQELNPPLSLLTNRQLQRALQRPIPYLNSPAGFASMLGLHNPYNPMSIEELVSQNAYPFGYPPGIPTPSISPYQGFPGLNPALQQRLMEANNPLAGFPNANQLAPTTSLSSLLANAIKTSLTQSQPDPITTALNQAALRVQAQNQPPQMLTSALTQALAKVVNQNTEPSEEEKLTQILAAALNSAQTQKRFIPTSSSLKLEIVNPTTQPFIPAVQASNQGRAAGPAGQQIISLNVSPVIPQQALGNAPPVVPQQHTGNVSPVLPPQNPGNIPPVLPQQSPANVPPASPQQNPANTPSVLPQQSHGNIPSVLPQQNPANAPPVVPQPNTANLLPTAPQQPQQPAPNTPILDQISASALGKAMAKALVHTAKKIVYNKSVLQRDNILKGKGYVQVPRQLQKYIQTAYFNSHQRSDPQYRTFVGLTGLNSLHRCLGPISMKYLRHQCHCCC